jgi:hypothetical protein
MVAHPSCTAAPEKLRAFNVHSNPPGISGSLIEGRINYGAFVLKNKAAGIYYQSIVNLSADLNIAADQDLYGKTVSDLQSNVKISGNDISGTLNYIDDYSSAFSGELASGNYLALHIDAPAAATVKVKLTEESTLDDDRIIVLRIADKNIQEIKVTCILGDKTVTRTYTLSGLTCKSA